MRFVAVSLLAVFIFVFMGSSCILHISTPHWGSLIGGLTCFASLFCVFPLLPVWCVGLLQLSSDYRRMTMPYAGPVGAPAAASAAAAPYAQGANLYDPAALAAAYTGTGQSQMMSEWPAYANPYYMGFPPGPGLVPPVHDPVPASTGFVPQMGPPFRPPHIPHSSSVNSPPARTLAEERKESDQSSSGNVTATSESGETEEKADAVSGEGASDTSKDAVRSSSGASGDKATSTRDGAFITTSLTTAVASAPLVCATTATSTNVHASHSTPGMWYFPPNPQNPHAPGMWSVVPPTMFTPAYTSVPAPPVFPPPATGPTNQVMYNHHHSVMPPQTSHFYQPYQQHNTDHMFGHLPDMMNQLNVS